MQKILLVTGATDGIGLETAKKLATQGHHLVIHGRNPSKVTAVQSTLKSIGKGKIGPLVADLSSFEAMCEMINTINQTYDKLDVIINNAGIFSTSADDNRQRLGCAIYGQYYRSLPHNSSASACNDPSSRVINLSSARTSTCKLACSRGKAAA